MPKTYRIDPTQNVELQFNKALRQIIIDSTMNMIREKVTRAVDKEIGGTFRMMSQMLMAQRSNSASPPAQIREYVPAGWTPLQARYKAEKRKRVGHSRWFVFGYRYPSRADLDYDERMLVDEFKSISPSRVLGVAGKSQAVVRRNKSGVTIKMMPNLRFRTNNFEEQFADVLSEKALYKLGNRIDRYRALVGPTFAYVLDQRIPDVVSRALGGKR